MSSADKPTIYTASKTKHAQLWRDLRDSGFVNVISTWIDEAGVGETSDFSDLWRRCVFEASTADALLLYRKEGEVLKGALVEAGCALAKGKRVYCVGDVLGYSFTNHPNAICCESIHEAVDRIAQEAR